MLAYARRQNEATRVRLIRTALNLFAVRSFEGTTIMEISNPADVGAFFAYSTANEDVSAETGGLLDEMTIKGVAT